MSVLMSKDKKDLIVTCRCGCEESMRIKVIYDEDCDDYTCLSYLNGNFYKDQQGAWTCFKQKLKKIWCILRNKDFYYSDIILTKEDWVEFKDWVNSVED